MARDHVHDTLRRIPLFADFSQADFEELDPLATEVRLSDGQVLFEQGSFGHEMVVVLDGVLDVVRDGSHIADITTGGFAGEMALLTRARRNSTVRAKGPVTVLHIDGRGFDDLLERVPRLAGKMLPIVAERLSALDDDAVR
jgi:CRP/FNR family cyclic AMP-dependent transcriptional regulator